MLFVGIGFLLSGTVISTIYHIRIKMGKTVMNWWDVLFVGLAQAVAIFPGVSRAGMTSTMSIKRGMGIDSSLNFSFLMYIPLSIGTLLLYLSEIGKEGLGIMSVEYVWFYLLSFVGAAIATYIAFKLIFNVYRNGKLKYFAIYLVILGLFTVFYFVAQY